VHDRQVPVQHDHVVVVHAEPLECRAAVVHHVHRVGVGAQAVGHRAGEHRLILDHQDPHGSMVTYGDVIWPSMFSETPR